MKSLLKKTKHLIEFAFVMLFFKLFKLLGYSKSANFMGCFMVAIGKMISWHKKICKNLELSALKIPKRKIPRIASQVLDNFGRYIAEFQFIHSWNKKELKKHIVVSGEENLIKVGKKPIIMLTPHMANWEILVRYFYFRKDKIMIINRAMNNPYVNKLLVGYRSKRSNFEYVDKNQTSKKLIEAAKNNLLVGMLADVKLQGEEINFLGRPAESSTIVARMRLKYNMDIIPVKIERFARTKFKINFLPAIKFADEDLEKGDLTAMTVTVHQAYESMIAENPGQWFWLHNRWKLKKREALVNQEPILKKL